MLRMTWYHPAQFCSDIARDTPGKVGIASIFIGFLLAMVAGYGENVLF